MHFFEGQIIVYKIKNFFGSTLQISMKFRK